MVWKTERQKARELGEGREEGDVWGNGCTLCGSNKITFTFFIFNKFSHEKTAKDIILLEAKSKFFSDLFFEIKCVYLRYHNELFTVCAIF